MGLRKFAILTSTLMLFCSFAFAQTQPSQTKQPSDPAVDAEKAKKKKELDERVVQMLDQSVSDATGLRLPQNRAIVYAMSADLYWKFDSKRSRELFRTAAAEIGTYNFEAEKEKRESTEIGMPEMYDPNDPRIEVLSLIGNRDADLALELLIQTRSASLAEAMAKASQQDAKAEGDTSFDPDRQRVSREIALELQFALLAANDDPEKAVKLIKESLAKGISFSVITLLQRLYQKDEKKAGELADAVIKKLVDLDLTKSNEDMRTAFNFLQFAARKNPAPNAKIKQFSFSETQTRDIANKMVSTFLQPSKSMLVTLTMSEAMPLLEKLVPEKIEILKQRLAESKKSLPTEIGKEMQRQKLWDGNSTPENILAQLPKMSNENDKRMAYSALTMKISQITDEARAKRLIDQIPDAKARADAMQQFESSRFSRLASAGKLDEARMLIGNLTNKKIQIQRLVALAVQFQRKGGETNIETAKSLMTDAKSMTNQFPEDEDELGDLLEVVKGYAAVEPDVAFRMFEPVIDQFNDIIQATAVLSKYNKRDRSFKKGELVMKVNGNFGGGLLLFRYIPQMQMLGKADLERMSLLSDRFVRSDTRTIVKLFVIQGFMQPDRKPATPAPSTGTGIVTKF